MSSETDARPSRNEPCPCGSGKKYKRCCGVGSEPILGTVKANPQFDPSSMDPAMMNQLGEVQKAMSKLPKGQLQRLQGLMQKAMAGKDVNRELEELGQSLPPGFMDQVNQMKIPDGFAEKMGLGGGDEAPVAPMSTSDAEKMVREAAARGEISEEQARELLGNTQATKDFGEKNREDGAQEGKKKRPKFWNFFKKK